MVEILLSSHRTEVFIFQNPKSLTLDWHHPAFSHWCCQEYLGGPACAVGGKSTLFGIMDDPRVVPCSQGIERGLEVTKETHLCFRKSWAEFRSFINKNIKINKQYR